MDPEPDPVALGGRGDGIVEVPCGRGVDGEGGQIGEVSPRHLHLAGAGDRIPGLVLDRTREAAPRAPIPQQGLHHIVSAFSGAERTERLGAAGPEVNQRDVARSELHAAPLERDLRPALEQRPRNGEAPPALDARHATTEPRAAPRTHLFWTARSSASTDRPFLSASSPGFPGRLGAGTCGVIPSPRSEVPLAVK